MALSAHLRSFFKSFQQLNNFELRELFNLLDYDGGGTVGVDEFCEGVLKAGG